MDFRLTARRDAKAVKAFLNKAIEPVRLHRPVSICTDKAPTYRNVIRDVFKVACDRQLPVLMVTHDAEDAEAAGGTIIALENLSKT